MKLLTFDLLTLTHETISFAISRISSRIGWRYALSGTSIWRQYSRLAIDVCNGRWLVHASKTKILGFGPSLPMFDGAARCIRGWCNVFSSRDCQLVCEQLLHSRKPYLWTVSPELALMLREIETKNCKISTASSEEDPTSQWRRYIQWLGAYSWSAVAMGRRLSGWNVSGWVKTDSIIFEASIAPISSFMRVLAASSKRSSYTKRMVVQSFRIRKYSFSV